VVGIVNMGVVVEGYWTSEKVEVAPAGPNSSLGCIVARLLLRVIDNGA